MAYLSPGVYVEEVDTGARPIEAIGTSTAGFVGTAPSAERQGEAVAINNWSQFVRIYVRDNGKPESLPGNDLANAVHGFFLNGGSRCYVVNIGNATPVSKGLEKLDVIDEIAIIAAPGRTDAATHSALVDAAESARDRVAILDAVATVEDVEVLTRVANPVMPPKDGKAEVDSKGAAAPPPAAGLAMSEKGYAAGYFPWLLVRDALDQTKIVPAAPSGYMAGIYARIDAERGVHKAPANVSVRGAVGVTQVVSRSEQDVLNPAGVNCIRFFTREGVRVWGARTRAPSASNWRYINVRRLFNMIEESIAISTRWVVFEPNDRFLWKQIRRDIGAFLRQLWQQGALVGATEEEAFFVKCDEETNPPEEIDAGRVVTLIGIAPSKPAEFVIFRIGQTASGSSVDNA